MKAVFRSSKGAAGSALRCSRMVSCASKGPLVNWRVDLPTKLHMRNSRGPLGLS